MKLFKKLLETLCFVAVFAFAVTVFAYAVAGAFGGPK